MNIGSSGLLKAVTLARTLCRAQSCRQQAFRQEGSRASQYRAICSSQARRPRATGLSLPSQTSRKRLFHPTANRHATKNPYSVLGVDKTASASAVKKAYYGLAKKFHPDTNKDPTAKDRFAEAQSAYEILTDPQKKAAWDQFGSAAFDQGAGPGPGSGGTPFGGNPFSGAAGAGGFPGGGFSSGGFGADFIFEDLFRGFTGKRSRSARSNPMQYEIVGSDIEAQVNVSFMEAAKGSSKTIAITPLTKCKPCSGKGLKPGIQRSKCKACGGTGAQVFEAGGFHVSATCGACEGQGTAVPKGGECRTCSGNGAVRERKTVHIDIPGGIEDDARLRIRNEGDAPLTGQAPNPDARSTPGDLYVRVRVATDPKFGRNGSNVLYTATIPLTTAILGGEVNIPTLDGETKVKIATGATTGDKITLTGMGMKKLEGRRGLGDMKVEFKVVMPKYLSTNQRAIVEMLAEEMGDKTAKRIVNVGQASSSDSNAASEKNEGFLKSVWHKLTESSTPGGNQTGNSSTTGSTSSSEEEDRNHKKHLG